MVTYAELPQQHDPLTVKELIQALCLLDRPGSLACVVIGGNPLLQDGRIGLVYKIVPVSDTDLVVIAGDAA